MKPRKILFWLHLLAGVITGLVIAIMSFTGLCIAFEKQIVAWAESDLRNFSMPAKGTEKLSMDQIVASFKKEHPEANPSAITLVKEPGKTVAISVGREIVYYVNPYTSHVGGPGAVGWRKAMKLMTDWHRWLAREGEGRAVGKAITGACNVACFFLAVTGLCLWWPKNWSKAAVRAISLFNFKLSGKARDWNWHNVIGLWCTPILIVLTITGVVISYRWAGDLVYKLTGTQPQPAQTGAGRTARNEASAPTPRAVDELKNDEIFALAKKEFPQWQSITLRLAGAGVGAAAAKEERKLGAQPVSLQIRDGGSPSFVQAQLSLDPVTGAVLKSESYEKYNSGRKIRTWMRFLHTGEALGTVGQIAAAVASLGGLVLVWTGFTMACRRMMVWCRLRFQKNEIGLVKTEPQ